MTLNDNYFNFILSRLEYLYNHTMTNKITQNIRTDNLSLLWLFTFAEGHDYSG